MVQKKLTVSVDRWMLHYPLAHCPTHKMGLHEWSFEKPYLSSSRAHFSIAFIFLGGRRTYYQKCIIRVLHSCTCSHFWSGDVGMFSLVVFHLQEKSLFRKLLLCRCYISNAIWVVSNCANSTMSGIFCCERTELYDSSSSLQALVTILRVYIYTDNSRGICSKSI